jgi:nitrile hydratase beta subunit
MNGIHDLGGMQGFGPILAEQPEPFREDWERVTFALMMTLTCHTQLWSDNENRHAVETMGNVDYLTTPYYEHWLHAIETLVVRKGLCSQRQLDDRLEQIAAGQGDSTSRPHDTLLTEQIVSSVRQRNDSRCPSARQPVFLSGDAVVTTRETPEGHTRLPRYARGCVGTVLAYRGAFVFPDSEAMGTGEKPQPLYTVRFEASDLWGSSARGRDAVMVDLWEDHLQPASGRTDTR